MKKAVLIAACLAGFTVPALAGDDPLSAFDSSSSLPHDPAFGLQLTPEQEEAALDARIARQHAHPRANTVRRPGLCLKSATVAGQSAKCSASITGPYFATLGQMPHSPPSPPMKTFAGPLPRSHSRFSLGMPQRNWRFCGSLNGA
jgi:hypothetical protein